MPTTSANMAEETKVKPFGLLLHQQRYLFTVGKDVARLFTYEQYKWNF